MGLQQLKLHVVGMGPLLMHNSQLASPLNAYTKALKKLTGKRNKTEADHYDLARLEWEGGLYLHDGLVVMPGENIFSCLVAGGYKSKRAAKIKSGCQISENVCALNYKGPKIKFNGNGKNGELPNPELDKFFAQYHHTATVVVNRRRLDRTRPILHDWSFTCTVDYDNNVLEGSEIVKVAEDAGVLVGLGDWRPRFGRFMVEQVG